jgi:hypothetical protein
LDAGVVGDADFMRFIAKFRGETANGDPPNPSL